MDRRAFLTAAAGAAATVPPKFDAAAKLGAYETGVPLDVPGLPLGPLPNARSSGTHIESLDKRFKGGNGTGTVERVATGFRWAEGPAYFPAGRYLIWSDIPSDRMMRLLEDDNHVSVFRSPSMNSNGNTVDMQGRLVTAEHGARRIVRTEFDGTVTIIADSYNGKKLNSPNDLVVASNGSIWFTDPTYGVRGSHESEIQQDKRNVFRVDPKFGDIKVVVDDFVQPNGIAFSPDETTLYVIDSGISEGPGNPAHIRSFNVDILSGRVANGKVFAEDFAPGFTDGMRCDVEGNVWCSMGRSDPREDGVRCYSPQGELLGKIHLPETASNLTFGGLHRDRLYICASTSIYACYVGTQGAVRP